MPAGDSRGRGQSRRLLKPGEQGIDALGGGIVGRARVRAGGNAGVAQGQDFMLGVVKH